MEKVAQIRQISKNNNKFQQAAKNIEGFCFLFLFFLVSYLVYSQIWLNYFLKDCHFDYITKSLKERNPASPEQRFFYWRIFVKSLPEKYDFNL
jgi:hypothetical protein